MPSESEHRLEGLLRAWAKTRRAQAGKAFELHPATRRLLLGEMVRSFPKRSEPRMPWRLALRRFWARTLSLVGFFLILGLVAWAAKNFWGNLPRYGDFAQDDLNPPSQVAFSLRKRPVEEGERMLRAANSASSQASQIVAGPLPSTTPRGMVGQVEGGRRAAPADSLEALNAPFTPLPPGQVAMGSDSAPPAARAAAPGPFAFSRTERSSGDTFKPVVSRTLATGGVAALAESLGKKAERAGAAESATGLKPADDEARRAWLAQAGAVTPSPATAPAPAVMPSEPKTQPSLTLAPTNAPVVANYGAGGGGANLKSGLADRQISTAAAVGAPRPARPSEESAAHLALGARPSAPAVPARAFPAAASADTNSASQFFARLNDAKQKEATPVNREFGTALVEPKGDAMLTKRLLEKESTPLVLNRFELRQRGTKATLIDADGSMYEGELSGQSADGTVLARSDRTDLVAERFRTTGSLTNAVAMKSLLQNKDVARPFFLRAFGHNRSLNQPVFLSVVVSGGTDELNAVMRDKPVAGPAGRGQGTRAGSAPPAVAGGAATAGSADFKFQQTEVQAENGRLSEVGLGTNLLVLEGKVRIGTNAEQPFKAVRLP
jgi:hypothetical protein